MTEVVRAMPQAAALAGSAPSQSSLSRPSAPVAIANGPDLWRAILARMPAGSVIAGGAVRDYLLGVEPKDIDVFMDITAEGVSAEADDDLLLPTDARFGLYRIDNEHERFEEYAAVSNIACVSSGKMFGHRVDAVVIEGFTGGIDLIEGFDFGITRSWFDGEIHDTPEAKFDRDNRTVTLLLTDRVERSLTRFDRLNARWGGGWALARDTDGSRNGGDACGSVRSTTGGAEGIAKEQGA